MSCLVLVRLRSAPVLVWLIAFIFLHVEFGFGQSSENVAASGTSKVAINPFKTVEEFLPVSVKHLRFTVLNSNAKAPSIDELEVFTNGVEPQNVALASNGGLASSSAIRGDNLFLVDNLVDGLYGQKNSWRADEVANVWVQVSFPRKERIDRVVWSRDRTGTHWDRTPIEYRIDVAEELGAWTTVASSADRNPGLIFDPVSFPEFDEPGLANPTSPLKAPVNSYQNVDSFAPVEAQYIRFTMQAVLGQLPSLDEFEVYSPKTDGLNIALAESGAIASSSNADTNSSDYDSAHYLNDGLYGDKVVWRGTNPSENWVQIRLPQPTQVHQVIWSRDRLDGWFDRAPTRYRIEIAKEAGQWVEVASSRDRPELGTLEFSADRKELGGYLIDSWGEDEGYPLNSINDICQTPDGYLWLASDSGLIRFDGNQFVLFDKNNTPEFSISRIPTLNVDKAGRLWIANQKYFYDSSNNLVLYEGGVFRRIDLQPGYRVLDFFDESDGTLWFLTNQGAVPWGAGQLDYDRELSRFEQSSLRYSDSYLDTENTHTWSGRPGKWIHGEFIPFFGGSGRPVALEYSPRYFRQFSRRDGGGWILEGGSNDSQTMGSIRWRRQFSDDGLSPSAPFPWGKVPSRIEATITDHLDQLWVSSKGQGLFCLFADGRGYRSFADEPGLENQSIKKLFEDMEGNMWLTTESAGIKRLRRRLIKSIDAKQGMLSRSKSAVVDNVYSVSPAAGGGVWLGTHASSAYRWNDGKLTYLLNSFGSSWSIMEDSRGMVWSGAYGRGVRLHRRNQVQIFNGDGSHPFSFMEDSLQRIWSGGDYGLFCFDQGTVSQFVPPAFAKGRFDWVISLAEGVDGSIWLGTKLGFLHRFQAGRFETFFSSEKGSEFPVCALHFDHSGSLWLARFGFGLTRLKEGELTHYTQAEGLPTSLINGILGDPRGFLWMTSKQGVYRISIADFGTFAEGNSSKNIWQRFTEKHGLPSNECHGEQNQPSLCQTDDGRIWVPTVKGIGVIDPDLIEDHSVAPPIVIQEVTLYGGGNHVETLLSDGSFSNRADSDPVLLTIPPGNNNLFVRYSAIEFTEPRQVHFRYRILGLDENWIDAKNERTALISSLRSGSYEFELIAANHLGISGSPVSFRFIVLPYWWETTVFRFLLAASIFVSGLAWYSKRVRELKKKNELQADFLRQLIAREEAERKRFSQELHDSLGHELLLVRNRALDGANRAGTESEQQQFEDISEMAGKAIENARGMAYNLRPFELDRIGFRKAIESMISKISESSSTRYFKDVDELDEVLSSVQLVYLYRLIQEGLNNILKHSRASVVMLEIKKHEGQVLVQLDDNGVGFDSRSVKSGLGINGMNERVKLIGGDFQLTSTPGGGTRIQIQIPI